MVSQLLDTSIVVDVLRGYLLARTWLSNNSDLGITRIVWLEVIEGAENRREQERAVKTLKEFELVTLTVEDMDWAVDKLLQFNLSHNLDAVDCLIASANYRQQLPLYTRNLKHFTPLLGTLAQNPY
jgi:predicted nucleic acid-binding protein